MTKVILRDIFNPLSYTCINRDTYIVYNLLYIYFLFTITLIFFNYLYKSMNKDIIELKQKNLNSINYRKVVRSIETFNKDKLKPLNDSKRISDDNWKYDLGFNN